MLMKHPLSDSRQLSAHHLLHRAGQCADELFDSQARKFELTPRQFVVLKAVAAGDEPSQTTIVEMTGIDRSTLADIVRRLVSRGLLSRKRTRRDARMYAVRVTDKGMNAIKQTEPAAKATEERILAAIPAGQRQEFLETLAQVVDQLSRPSLDEKN